jgi:hypothetical protein
MIELLASLWLAATDPELTDTGVPSPTNDAQSFDEASAAFDARVRSLHPPGSEAAALAEALREEGFALGEGEARLERPGFLCELEWTVRWTEEGGRIARVEGAHSGVCL